MKAMESALLLYANDSGRGSAYRHIEKIKDRLKKAFPVLDASETRDAEDGRKKAQAACGKYDALIFIGGDGTFNNIIAALADKEDAPVLGYISAGTMADEGRTFGIRRSWKSSLKIIERGKVTDFDVFKINDRYFGYMAAVGAFSDISYSAKRSKKKRFGKLTYYFMAVGRAFRKQKVEGEILVGERSIPFSAPFIMILSGRYVGGFKVNPKGKANDGMGELFLVKKGIFNGLARYFFHVGVTRISAPAFEIKLKEDALWTVDGEKGPSGNVAISCNPQKLRIFCK